MVKRAPVNSRAELYAAQGALSRRRLPEPGDTPSLTNRGRLRNPDEPKICLHSVGTRFGRNGVQPYSVDTVLMGIHQQLPTLVALISVKTLLYCPLSGMTRDLLNTLDAGDPRVDIGVRAKLTVRPLPAM